MSVSISEEDFQRLQNSLIDLKNENYTLQERTKKQSKALDEVTAKSSQVEADLARANKTILKSKKAVEVQQLLKENQSLSHKLSTQDEDFRIQNQTLLHELSKLVEQNEKLEKRVKQLDCDPDSQAGKQQLPLSEKDLLQLLETERKNSCRLAAENSQLRDRLVKAGRVKRPSESSRQEETVAVDIEVSSTKLGAVSFKKVSPVQDEGDECVADTTPDPLPSDVEGSNPSSCSSTEEEKDTDTWKLRCLSLQAQVTEYQEKLRKKQDSLIQIQREKELQFQELTIKSEEVKVDKDQEILSLREQAQRLQGQLNFGRTSYADFKDKKAVEVQQLHDQIKDLQARVGSSSSAAEVGSEGEAVESTNLSEENQRLKTQCASLSDERESLSKQVQSLMTKINAEVQEKTDLEEKITTLQSKLEEAVKTSDNRKSLLDEMAVTLQTKSDEAKATIARMENDLEQAASILKERETELSAVEKDLEATAEAAEASQLESDQLADSLAELEARIQEEAAAHNSTLTDLKESNEEEVRYLRADQEIAVRDLSMQLEISNAQVTEFEERLGEMAQEITDMAEERKIAEKKSQALTKDLKRQLLAEKQRNEKLSDKLDKLLAETSQNVLDPPRGASGSAGGPRTNDTESECDEAKSTGSWSIYSDSPKNGPRAASNNSLTAAAAVAAAAVAAAPPTAAVSDEDVSALLAKIESLQTDKFGLEQRAQMLEGSAAAMADELVRKSEIILHYCMEGKHLNVLKTAQSGSSGATSASGGASGVVSSDSSDSLKSNKLIKAMEQKAMSLKNSLNNVNNNNSVQNQERDMRQMQRCLEETLTKNMHLQKDLESMAQEIVKLSKTDMAQEIVRLSKTTDAGETRVQQNQHKS